MKLKITSFITAICLAANVIAGTFSVKSGSGYLETGTDCIIFKDAQQGSISYSSGNIPLRNLICFEVTKQGDEMGIDTIKTENIALSTDSQSVTINNLSANTGYKITYTNYSRNDSIRDSAYAYVMNYQPLTHVSFPDSVGCGEDVRLQLEPTMQWINKYGNPQKVKRELSIGYHSFGLRSEKPTIDSISYTTTATDYHILDSMPYTDTKFYVTDLTFKKLSKDSVLVVVSDSIFHNSSIISFPTMETSTKQEHEADDSQDHFVRFTEEHNDAVNVVQRFRHSGPLFLNLESNANDTTNAYHYEWAFVSDENATRGDYDNAFTQHGSYVNAFKFEDPGLHCIRLTVRDLNDTTCKHQSYACLQISDSKIAAPNVFTPNGDGVNDEFRVSYQSIATFEISIYDQWGRRVYQSTDITQGWDGTFHGKLASIGTYFYVIKAVGTDDEEYILKGDINLIRSKK